MGILPILGRERRRPVPFWLMALGAGWLGLAASAQTGGPGLPPAPMKANEVPPPTPPNLVSTTTPDNTRYLNNPTLLAGCKARLAAISGQPCQVIFIGDSITADWLTVGKAVWDKFYLPHHALNLGVSGDKTQNVLWRLTTMNLEQIDNMDVQQVFHNKVAVILIGTNNGANDPGDIAAGVEEVVSATEDDLPSAKIILVSIPPNTRDNAKMMQVDSLLKKFADNNTVHYLDLVPLMPQIATTLPDGKTEASWKGLAADGLNFNATGYEIWANAMEPLLTKLLAAK